MLDKICERCGNAFKAKRSAARFCSRSCSAKTSHEKGFHDNHNKLRRTGFNRSCTNCGKEVYVKQHENKRGRGRFCSQECKSAYEVKDKSLSKQCAICGSTFTVGKFRYSRAKYCSRKCYYKAMAHVGSVVAECVVCGKVHRRPPSHTKHVPTCSMNCRSLYNLAKSNKPKDTDHQITKWFWRRGLVTKCTRCGYKEHPEILVIHHSDRNRTNNKLTNLEILCPNCHAIEHYSENKNGWKHDSKSRKALRASLIKQDRQLAAIG